MMSSREPVVSVIMPVLNAERTLRMAFQSLAAQDFPYEAILVDGGSQDATLAIASEVAGLQIISDPGSSIYGAINRGIESATTGAICLLNADDTLLPLALETWVRGLASAPSAGIARGRPRFVELAKDGSRTVSSEAEHRTSGPMTLDLLMRGPCSINSQCIRKSVFNEVGLFDTTLRYAADRDWLLRAYQAGVQTAELSKPVYQYLIHEGSSTLDRSRRNYGAIRKEHLTIIRHNLSEEDPPKDPALRTSLLKWHAAESAMLAVHTAVRQTNVREAAGVLIRAFKTSPYWLATLAAQVIRRGY